MPFYKTRTKPDKNSEIIGISTPVLIEARTKSRAKQIAREQNLYVAEITEFYLSRIYHDKE